MTKIPAIAFLGTALGCQPGVTSVELARPAVVAPSTPQTVPIAPARVPPNTLKSQVRAVTVYSDRALVTRTAKVETAPNAREVAFRGLPGWVDDASVRVATTAGRIADVRVERNFLSQSPNPEWKEIDEEHRRLVARRDALTDELAVLAAQKQQIEAIKAFSLEKITKDTTVGNVSVKSYADVLSFITASLRKTAKERRAVQHRLDTLTPKVTASAKRVQEKTKLMKLEETTVYVTMYGKKRLPAELSLTYMLPGATWEPQHELRVSSKDSDKVELLSFAKVTQTSGEDWQGARVSFSTQSTTEAVKIPELKSLALGQTHKTTQYITKKMTSFRRAQRAYSGQNLLWNQYQTRERVSLDASYSSNIRAFELTQRKTVEIFESLQRRGTTAQFRSLATPTIRGDGHPVRMQIGRSGLAASQRIVAAPEQSLNAAHTVEMSNATGQPLLPGRVALYKDGAFLGMTELGFIAEGERFPVFIGVADHLKLSRKLDRKRSSLVMRKRHRMQLSFVVTVENLSDVMTKMTLADRIPVSENRDIRVSRVQITPAARPDSSGILHWELSLKPKEKRSFRVSYKVDYPPTLILQTRRKQMSKPRRKSRDISDRILEYEEALK